MNEPETDGRFAADSGSRPKVIYVMGAGRSGSTILGVALGNCDGVLFAGELDKWFSRDGAPRRDGSELAEFWATVRERVGDDADVRDVLAGRTGWIERSSAALDPRTVRVRRRLRGRYRSVSARLYRAVADLAGVACVVDTSHYPLRARELQALDGRDGGIGLYLVWLVRDPHAVVASLDRRDVAERRFALGAANAYLSLTNLLCARVFARQPRARRLLVRHEQLLADPRGTLREILDLVGVRASLPDFDALTVGVPFHGNRLVCSPTVALRTAAPPPNARSPLTSALQLPWRLVLRRYTAGPR
jgi:hypothetical protein